MKPGPSPRELINTLPLYGPRALCAEAEMAPEKEATRSNVQPLKGRGRVRDVLAAKSTVQVRYIRNSVMPRTNAW